VPASPAAEPASGAAAVRAQARCPLMLFLEVQELQTSVADAMRSGSVSLLTNGGAAPTATTLPTDTAPDVTARKREGWAAKASRPPAPDPPAPPSAAYLPLHRTKVERIGGASELKPSTPGWKLTSMFVKSNDDLRQEVFVMQMIAYCQRIFPQAPPPATDLPR
jgi:hypothetical protein